MNNASGTDFTVDVVGKQEEQQGIAAYPRRKVVE
jgi:hypothetical protein